MSTRSSRFQVKFEQDGSGAVVASFSQIEGKAKETARTLSEAEKSAYEFGQKLGAALKWTGGAVLAGIALIVRNTMQAEQELAQLGAVLKSTGQDANFTRDQMVQMAEGIAQASTFSAGEITKAETRLLSYSGIARGNFRDALQVAIDQATRLGISVEQSSEIVGRALESPTKAAAALAQQGFGAAFTDSVRKSIAALEDAGRTAEAQQIVLDILKESYGGAAQEARDTFGGALIALKNTLGDLTTGSDGSLDGAKDAVNQLTATLNSPETKQAFADITSWVADLSAKMIEGAAIIANYITQTRAIGNLGDGDLKQGDASEQALVTRQEFLQEQLRRRHSGALGRVTADLNDGNIQSRGYLGALKDTFAKRAELDRRDQLEILEIDKELSRRKQAAQVVKAVDDAFNFWAPPPPVGKGGGGGGGGNTKTPKPALTEEERAAKQLQQTYDQVTQSLAERSFMLGKTGEAGKIAWLTEFGALKALSPELKSLLKVQAEKYDADQKAYELKQAELEQNKRLLDDAQRMRADYEFQIQLLGKTREQQELLVRARQLGAAAATDEGRAALDALQKYQQTARSMDQQIDVADEIRRAGRDLVVDLGHARLTVDGILDAWDHINEKILQMIADNLMEKLFGAPGSAPGGAAGGWLGSLLGGLFGGSGNAGGASASSSPWGAFAPNQPGFGGAQAAGGSGWMGSAVSWIAGLFGGARELGGPVAAGRFYRVNERAPELLTVGSDTYLMMGRQSGRVDPAPASGAGVVMNVTNNFSERVDRRSRAAVESASLRGAQMLAVRR